MWVVVGDTLRRIVLFKVRLTVNKMAGRLPPVVSSVYMGNLFCSAERSDREQNLDFAVAITESVLHFVLICNHLFR